MRRALSLAASVAAIVPALATAASAASTASWSGIVVAKDSHRATVATASADGTVRTLRVGSQFGRLALGQRLQVGAAALADGTFRLSSAARLGTAAKARVRGVVVGYDRGSASYLLSAGDTMLTVRAGAVRRLSAASQPLTPGTQVVADATLAGNGVLTAPQVSSVGQVSTVELDGILTSMTAQQVQLAVLGRGLVSVAVPAGVTLPTLAPGTQVQVAASVGADGTFALVSIQGDAAAAGGGQAVNVDQSSGKVEVEGTIASLSPTAIGLQPGAGASAVTCAIQAGTDLTGFAVGDAVQAKCVSRAGTLTLIKLEAGDRQGSGNDEHGNGNGQNGESDSENEDGGGRVAVGTQPLLGAGSGSQSGGSQSGAGSERGGSDGGTNGGGDD